MEREGNIPIAECLTQEGKTRSGSRVREPDNKDQDTNTNLFTLNEDKITLKEEITALKLELEEQKKLHNNLLEVNRQQKHQIETANKQNSELQEEINKLNAKLPKEQNDQNSLDKLQKINAENINSYFQELQKLQLEMEKDNAGINVDSNRPKAKLIQLLTALSTSIIVEAAEAVNAQIIRDLLKELHDVFSSLNCGSVEMHLNEVILLIFEKNISEPNFASTYAKFCQVLFNELKPEIKSKFTISIIKRIQTEYEENVSHPDAKRKLLEPLTERLKTCTDPKERQEIEAEIEEKEYQFRRRALGIVRFMGEMCKLKQLTPDRVMTCVESLQENGTEEKLEYMCKLLTTVGHLIDETASRIFVGKERMDKVFVKIIDTIKNAKLGKLKSPIGNRVLDMMQDVIDLRATGWYQAQSLINISATANISSSSASGGGSGNSGNTQHQQRKRDQDKKNNRNNYDRGGSSRRKGNGASNSQNYNRLDRHGSQGGGGGGANVVDLKKFTFFKNEDETEQK